MRRVYISGPISGTDDYLDRFARAEMAVSAMGCAAVNPAAVNDRLPEGTSYQCYMDTSLAMLRHCDMIYMTRGWRGSKGARLEKAYADALGIEAAYEDASEADDGGGE